MAALVALLLRESVTADIEQRTGLRYVLSIAITNQLKMP